MASDDDIERLLREVEALESGPSKAQPPVPAQSREPAKQQSASESGGGRTSWALIAAAGGGAAGFIIGTLLGFLPLVDGLSTGLGAAIGAAIAALIGGPPGWYRK
jgi:hypothetical protein